MRKDLEEYIKHIDLIEDKNIDNNLINDHLIKISFFQHERLIHLIVTMFTGLFCILFFIAAIISNHIELLILFAILFILFIPYILHYFFLENGVQKLYAQYDKLKKMLK